MNIEDLTTALRQYCNRKKLDSFASLQIFSDGSGILLNRNEKMIPGTSFDNMEQLVELLTGEKELQEAESKYVDALRNYYPQGTKIFMEVRGESVEVIIDKP